MPEMRSVFFDVRNSFGAEGMCVLLTMGATGCRDRRMLCTLTDADRTVIDAVVAMCEGLDEVGCAEDVLRDFYDYIGGGIVGKLAREEGEEEEEEEDHIDLIDSVEDEENVEGADYSGEVSGRILSIDIKSSSREARELGKEKENIKEKEGGDAGDMAAGDIVGDGNDGSYGKHGNTGKNMMRCKLAHECARGAEGCKYWKAHSKNQECLDPRDCYDYLPKQGRLRRYCR